jgi:signal transduction histidine kinase
VAPLPWRRLLAIVAGGVGLALFVLLAGWSVRRVLFGADQTAMRVRAETVLRDAFVSMAERLRQAGAFVASPADVRAALEGDVMAARRLLTEASDTLQAEGTVGAALTVYSAEGEPLAWAGRPSDLPSNRLQGDEAWFLADGALGLRLVYVRPVVADGVRLGSVAVERPLTSPAEATRLGPTGLQPTDGVIPFRTWIVPTTIQASLDVMGAPLEPDQVAISGPTGSRLLTATVADSDLLATRVRWASAARALAITVLAFTLLLLTGPILDWRNRVRATRPYVIGLTLIGSATVLARVLLRATAPGDWSATPIFSDVAYASPLLSPFLTSPFDFVLTTGTACALALLLLSAGEARRLHVRPQRRAVETGLDRAWFLVVQLLAGALVALICLGHQALLRDTITHTTLDVTHFSLHPWDTARLALQVGLILAHVTAVGLAVLVFRVALHPWCVPRADWRLRILVVVAWMLPLASQLGTAGTGMRGLPLVVAGAVIVVAAANASRLMARYRHGSQAFRLVFLTLPVIAPVFAFYPSVVQLARQAKSAFIESSYAPLVLDQRQTVQQQLRQSLGEIDAIADLTRLATPLESGAEPMTDRAFAIWQRTALARYPITSSVEVYGSDGTLVSRFAFNLPEDLSAAPQSVERSCEWDLYEEVAPFFAENRRVLHAGRAFCADDADAAPLGSVVVHAMPDDFGNLPFISSRSPYVDLLLPSDPLRGEGLSGRDVEFAVYGWSRTPLYPIAATAWPLPDEVFARIEQSRAPIWAQLARGTDRYDVYLLNDRFGIYALGVPALSRLSHLVNLAELTVLALLVYVLFLAGSALFNWLGHREMTAPALLRELRESFYRKLFLAFVAAVFVPVVALVLVTRNYVAAQMASSVEQEAVRTASAAGRVVADLVAPRAAAQGLDVDDNLMVWVSRLIDQDVNMFLGARLLATSERNMFASGLLPTRLDAGVYQALTLRNEAAVVTREQIGPVEYLVAATPLSVRSGGILTVPLASRQREIDAQLDTLDRRALLAALIFILGGAGLGYSMAERISDPVNRLTRATGRIARGDLDARITATSSDELRRLVEAFNGMASDLKRQRTELERTHRLEAWAEMARQVAHEIKNPLTPIQLNAEHLRRVHTDRGEPMGPVLQECVATILSQVTLLRQIASEFSSFASSPTARPAQVDIGALLLEILAPYQSGLESRIQVVVDIPAGLPPVFVDRVLVARSFTNIVENALHAMPGTGVLSVEARGAEDHVVIRVSDSGAGMDDEALARALEPYFSTKATGTGLGLPIAKRNVELNGGALTVSSALGRGTTVEFTLPTATAAG